MQELTLELPELQDIIKEINFMLYHHDKIDSLIEKRKRDLIDKMNFSPSAWFKGLKQDSNTMEDVIAGFDEDRLIKRYEQWRTFLGSLFSVIRNFERPIYYRYLALRYFNKLDKNEIMNILNIDEETYRYIKRKFYCIVYRYALKESLFKEVQNVAV